tara:strand:- start:52 stop:444 length:393 start_codon:yes stop_codon:yes gene_type:complete
VLRYILVLILLLQSHFVAASCSFEDLSHLYQKENAANDALKNFMEDRVALYVVANGFGPSRPGLDSPEQTCVLKEYWNNQIVLWAGADEVGSCKNGKETVILATKYALAYNKHLISLLKDSGHKCFTQVN